MLQFDFQGNLLFQHRNFAKWKLEGNRRIPGFKLEKECMRFVAELRVVWVPGIPCGVQKWDEDKAEAELQAVATNICKGRWKYTRVGLDAREIVFLPDGTIGEGAAGCEKWWTVKQLTSERSDITQGANDIGPMTEMSKLELQVYGEQGLTFRAVVNGDGNWHGRWEVYEKAEVVLARHPIRRKAKPVKERNIS